MRQKCVNFCVKHYIVGNILILYRSLVISDNGSKHYPHPVTKFIKPQTWYMILESIKELHQVNKVENAEEVNKPEAEENLGYMFGKARSFAENCWKNTKNVS